MQLAKTVHGAFAKAAVPVMALKGSALVARRFVDRSIRPIEDLDILVPPDRVADAMDVLERLGMRASPFRRDLLWRRVVPQAELPGSTFRTAEGDYVDLHWNAMHLDRRRDADVQMWQRSRPTDFEGAPIRVPDPVDLVLQICGHGAQDGGAALLLAVVDTAMVIRATKPFNWGALLARAGHHRMSAVVSSAFGLLADGLAMRTLRAPVMRLPVRPDPGSGSSSRPNDAIPDTAARTDRRAGRSGRLSPGACGTVSCAAAVGVAGLNAGGYGHAVDGCGAGARGLSRGPCDRCIA